ncbi:MFS transporter [Klebsiella pneumoniae]|uniref:MFS transporter n=1 Tax=Klebsiella pneumoniae TaxID=573 RepID=A0A939NQ77_KLEPN|nr:MFS transporter [Klebsiella pneumoniae]
MFSPAAPGGGSYIERVSRANRFEYGKCGSQAASAGRYAPITGVLFGIDPNITF